jgi:hypothetical protein
MKVRAARLSIAALVAVSTILLVSPSAHGDEGWLITSFQSDVSIGPDSTLTVREDIRVDFGSEHHHGIFRTIPTRYRYDNTRDRYYGLQVQSVTDGSKPIEFQLSGYDNMTIKIGDPNILVTGAQRYVLTYIVQGAMNSFSDHDELFWNVDGAMWPVPKAAVAATVHLPANAFKKAACYEGQPGSTEACRHVDGSNLVSYSSTRQLGSGEEMSIVTALNKGAVTVPAPMLEPRLRSFPQDAFDINPLTVGIAVLVLVAGIGFVVWNWLTHGRDRAYLTQYYLTNDPKEHAAPLFGRQPVVVEFEPPQNLRPAELGLILDERADPKDLTATIVDLAVRGFLTIAEVPGKKDWVLTQARNWDPAEIMPYENTILAGLFAGRQQVTLSDLRGTFTVELRTAERQMYQDAMSRKLFSSNPQQSRAAWGLPRHRLAERRHRGHDLPRAAVGLGVDRRGGRDRRHRHDRQLPVHDAAHRRWARPAPAHARLPSLHDDRGEISAAVRGEGRYLHPASPLCNRVRHRDFVGESIRRHRHQRQQQLVRGSGSLPGGTPGG